MRITKSDDPHDRKVLAYYAANKQAIDAEVARLAPRNHFKCAARAKARRAQVLGKIVAPAGCENCGGTSVKLQKHHPDYHKPTEVTFLCHRCHQSAINLPSYLLFD